MSENNVNETNLKAEELGKGLAWYTRWNRGGAEKGLVWADISKSDNFYIVLYYKFIQ